MATPVRNKVKATNATRVRFGPGNARATQDLGQGFRRTVFPSVTIPANTIRRIEMAAGTGRVVVTGGWSISQLQSAWATDTYPSTDQLWVLYIENPTNTARTVTPYLISKSRTLVITKKS